MSDEKIEFHVSRYELGHALLDETMKSYCVGQGDKFPLGDIWITPRLRARKMDWIALVRRHVTGDFGRFGHYDQIEVTDEEVAGGMWSTGSDAKLNKIAIIRGRGRVMSVYGDVRVITESNGQDAETTIMLKEEY